jgi:hypothetical protein
MSPRARAARSRREPQQARLDDASRQVDDAGALSVRLQVPVAEVSQDEGLRRMTAHPKLSMLPELPAPLPCGCKAWPTLLSLSLALAFLSKA